MCIFEQLNCPSWPRRSPAKPRGRCSPSASTALTPSPCARPSRACSHSVLSRCSCTTHVRPPRDPPPISWPSPSTRSNTPSPSPPQGLSTVPSKYITSSPSPFSSFTNMHVIATQITFEHVLIKVIPGMVERGRGTIIFTGSSASLTGSAGYCELSSISSTICFPKLLLFSIYGCSN